MLTIPLAGAIAAFTSAVTLLQAVYAGVPVAFAAGLGSVATYRRARALLDRSVRRPGESLVRVARILGLAGLYLAVSGAVALGFYGLLHLTS